MNNLLKKHAKNICFVAVITIFALCLGCRNTQTQINNQTKINTSLKSTVSPTPEVKTSEENKRWTPSGYLGI